MQILAINCGATSTKIGVFEDMQQIMSESFQHEAKADFDAETDLAERESVVGKFLGEHGYAEKDFDCIVARGGCFYPVQGGAYKLDENLVCALMETAHHAANLSGVLAYRMAQKAGIPSYIYDAVCVDELTPVARISGIKSVERYSRTHTLNTRAMARAAAEERGLDYRDLNIITAHLGGGTSVNIFEKGRLSDLVTSEEGGFSTERCGGLQGDSIVEIVKNEGLDRLRKYFHGQGGLVSYFGTNSAKEIDERIDNGDEEAALVFEAMAYQVAKSIASLSAVVKGKVDLIVLTGGVIYSSRFAEWIKDRVEFIAPVAIMPGEKELVSLARGALEVLAGNEEAKTYK